MKNIYDYEVSQYNRSDDSNRSALSVPSLLATLRANYPKFMTDLEGLPNNVEDSNGDEQLGQRSQVDELDSDENDSTVEVDYEGEAIERSQEQEALGWSTNNDTLSPKGMDRAEELAGLRDHD